MNNYKITNLRSSKNYFLNEEELTNFFKQNKVQNYDCKPNRAKKN